MRSRNVSNQAAARCCRPPTRPFASLGSMVASGDPAPPLCATTTMGSAVRGCRRSVRLLMRVAPPPYPPPPTGEGRVGGGADMKQHRVAILGGAGFIGRYVVKRLA